MRKKLQKYTFCVKIGTIFIDDQEMEKIVERKCLFSITIA